MAFTGFALFSCTSQKQATSYVTDEVYSIPAAERSVQPAVAQSSSGAAQVITSPDKASVSKPGSSTFEDDYNDYSYSSRIKRFNNTDTTRGYFDETYAPSSGSPGQDGSSWNNPNVNLYFGLGSGYGGFGGSYFGFGYGYPYSSYWGWDPWWNPYYWNYPYYGYNPWYNPWYRPWYNPCCCCYGYNDWYYNNGYPPYYTSGGTYYGPRESLYSTSHNQGNLNNRAAPVTANQSTNLNARSEGVPAVNTRNDQNISPVVANPTVNRSTVPASGEKYRYTRPGTVRKAPSGQPNDRMTRQQGNAQRSQPEPKYIRPENARTMQRSDATQSYSSPVYRQPKTSQEYLAPRTERNNATSSGSSNSRSVTSGGSGSGSSRSGSPSSDFLRSVNGNSRETYSAPSRSSNSYSAPTRSGNSGSYSAPTRSSGSDSYSAPSRSSGSGSYSAPSRSSGSGGSTPSSGSSGGGRRR